MTVVLVNSEKVRSLDELAQVIRTERDRAGGAALIAVRHGITAGIALLEARQQVTPGGWARWLEQNVGMTPKRAAGWMRLAEFREEIEAAVGLDAGLTEAARYLTAAGLTRRLDEGADVNPKQALKGEFERLKQSGMTHVEAGDAVGVTRGTAWAWTHPEKAREAQRRRDRARKERRAAEKVQRARAAAKHQGGAIAELYAMVERMQDILGAAHHDATDAEARRELSLAGTEYRRMRDHVIRALGAS